jgi:hypothetical protein
VLVAVVFLGGNRHFLFYPMVIVERIYDRTDTLYIFKSFFVSLHS